MITGVKGEQVSVSVTTQTTKFEPKNNVLAASVELYGYDISGSPVLFETNAADEIGTGFVRYLWEPPSGILYESGYARWTLTDSDGYEGVVQEDWVLTDPLATAEQVAALAASADFIEAMEGGRWLIDESTGIMTFFDEDNISTIAQFQLYDKNGDITLNPGCAYERRRIS